MSETSQSIPRVKIESYNDLDQLAVFLGMYILAASNSNTHSVYIHNYRFTSISEKS